MKVPDNAVMHNAGTGLYRTVIKILGLLGWDIASLIAQKSEVSIIELAKTSDMSVFQDHVIVDMNEIET